MTPTRADSMTHLSRIVTNALNRGDVVAIADTSFAYKEKGSTWDCGETTYEALSSGVYLKASVIRGGMDVGHTFLWQCHLDELPQLLKMLCSEMTLEQVEELRFELAAVNVLKTLTPRRELASESLAP